MTVDIQTFGCRLNAYESEIIRGHAERAGLADAVIINTCAVTAEASRQARQAIRKARRERPHADIIVTGCAAQTETEKFAAMPEITRLLGNEEKLQAASWLAHTNRPRVDVADIMQVKETRPPAIDRLSGRARAFMQVQTGCDHRCTFCIIPFGRGNARSVSIADAVNQIQRLAGEGHNEIVLSGVDLTSWGNDLDGRPRLGALVAALLKAVPALPRLRLSSIDSIEVDDELMELMSGESRLMPHLHLSLQSGDNMILKRMKRRHARENTIAFCNALRARRPDIVFGADIIAGFPTETEAMFENTLRIVDECGLTYLHVFPFSPRPGTPAARMPQLEQSVIRARARRLREKGEQRLADFLASCIGRTEQILAETPETGRTAQFASVRCHEPLTPGRISMARITGMAANHLTASLN